MVDNDSDSGILRIICAEYGPEKLPIIREIYQMPVANWTMTEALYICKDVVGIMIGSTLNDEYSSSIRFVDFTRDISISMAFGGHCSATSQALCSVIDEVPFIIISDKEVYHVYRCSPGDPKYWEDGATVELENSLVHVAEVHVMEEDDSSEREILELKCSARGLHAMHVLYNANYHGYTAHTLECFWPASERWTRAAPIRLDTREEIEAMTLSFNGNIWSYSGLDSPPWLVSTSPSGTYTIFAMQSNDYIGGDDLALRLHLLQISDDPALKPILDRQIELPFYIALDKIYSLAIDERCGVIYLSHVQGHLFTLPYA
ncbi:hypothetical protein H0H81_002006 [Sphagnurus paluster]|uniref:Uncharacterized protein n=1 Tax=Sphagnurus paluster TaxID=117069 RepID=A0A9P7GNM6_9AGAR|nr:hypothetical protein H0H81_002006 [Sphagnurus paluster]